MSKKKGYIRTSSLLFHTKKQTSTRLENSENVFDNLKKFSHRPSVWKTRVGAKQENCFKLTTFFSYSVIFWRLNGWELLPITEAVAESVFTCSTYRSDEIEIANHLSWSTLHENFSSSRIFFVNFWWCFWRTFSHLSFQSIEEYWAKQFRQLIAM